MDCELSLFAVNYYTASELRALFFIPLELILICYLVSWGYQSVIDFVEKE